jgi:hypothetical protein
MNQFLTSQGNGLQYTIGKINVHSILTEDIWVLKTAYFSPAHCWKHPQSPEGKHKLINFYVIYNLYFYREFKILLTINKYESAPLFPVARKLSIINALSSKLGAIDSESPKYFHQSYSNKFSRWLALSLQFATTTSLRV